MVSIFFESVSSAPISVDVSGVDSISSAFGFGVRGVFGAFEVFGFLGVFVGSNDSEIELLVDFVGADEVVMIGSGCVWIVI